MPQITLVVNLSEQKADQLSKIAQNLKCTTDDLLQSIIDRYLRDQDIMDRTMSIRDIHHVVAHSPIYQHLVKSEPPNFGNELGEAINVSFDVDDRLLGDWEKLLITQDIGLPMRWNARLVNVSEDKLVSSSDKEAYPEDFSHPELAQALEALSHHLQTQKPAEKKA